MKNPFDQRTLYTGSSIEEFNRIRNILDTNHVKYKYKTINLNHDAYLGSHGTERSVGGNLTRTQSSLLYEILINGEDYDHAVSVIKNTK